MSRTVQQIEEDDETKADLGADGLEGIQIDTLGGKDTLSAEDVAADLKKQLEAKDAQLLEERKLREEVEARATKSAGDANTSRQAQIASQEQAIKDRVTTAATKLESVKQQLKQAKAAGDGDNEVELSDAMAEARYELNAAKWEEGNFSRWKEQQKEAAPAAQVQTSGARYTAAEQAWLDKHPEFYTNKKFARVTKVLAAEALEEGHRQDSRGFFDYVESGLREEGLVDDDPTSGSDPIPKKTSTSVGTPPNRSGNGAAPIAPANKKYPYIPKGYTVPREWVEAAKDQGFDDPLEYANSRLEIEATERSGRA